MSGFDIITVGNATIDAFLGIHEASEHCHVNEKDKELCFPYGEKIPLDTCDFELGGNACNVAVGLSRLGFNTALVAETGDDEFAQKIMNLLSAEKVDKSFVQQTKGAAASFAVGLNYKGERTLFVKHTKRKHDFSFKNIATKWIYLSSVGNEWKHVYKAVIERVEADRTKLVFNPGTLQLAEKHDEITDVLARTDILFVNKEEAQKLLSCGDGCECSGAKEIKDLLIGLHGLGPKIVVITDGKNGSYASDSSASAYSLGIPNNPVIERTGAGDAYTAGFLGTFMQGLSIEEAMRSGALNAASVIGKTGSQPGLLTKLEMEKKLLEHADLKVKQI